jgi:small neutral amino acid transporter SnatA (MarC family)
MAEILKQLVGSRGTQLVSRYAAVGLTWLAAQAKVTADAAQVEATAGFVAMLAAGGVCLLIDLISHSIQKKAEK